MNTHNIKPGDVVEIASPITRTPYVVTVAAVDSPNRYCLTTTTGQPVSYRRIIRVMEVSQ